jgi:O6-methylguanine-DNA--protein-cysteine methyltransferase
VSPRDGIVPELKYLPLSAACFPERSKRAERQLEEYKRDRTAASICQCDRRHRATEIRLESDVRNPRGKTRTYGDLARELAADRATSDSAAAPAAAGDPCHRIVAADGIGGFARTTTAISWRRSVGS